MLLPPYRLRPHAGVGMQTAAEIQRLALLFYQRAATRAAPRAPHLTDLGHPRGRVGVAQAQLGQRAAPSV